jgi:hypothetical protein
MLYRDKCGRTITYKKQMCNDGREHRQMDTHDLREEHRRLDERESHWWSQRMDEIYEAQTFLGVGLSWCPTRVGVRHLYDTCQNSQTSFTKKNKLFSLLLHSKKVKHVLKQCYQWRSKDINFD